MNNNPWMQWSDNVLSRLSSKVEFKISNVGYVKYFTPDLNNPKNIYKILFYVMNNNINVVRSMWTDVWDDSRNKWRFPSDMEQETFKLIEFDRAQLTEWEWMASGIAIDCHDPDEFKRKEEIYIQRLLSSNVEDLNVHELYWRSSVLEKKYRQSLSDAIASKRAYEEIKIKRSYDVDKISFAYYVYIVGKTSLIKEIMNLLYKGWKSEDDLSCMIDSSFEKPLSSFSKNSISFQSIVNWMINDVARNEVSEKDISDVNKRNEYLLDIFKKEVVETVQIVEEKIENTELKDWCVESIKSHDRALLEFKSGKDSAINAFKGDIMKKSKGKYSPKLIDETLRDLIKSNLFDK